MVVQAVVLKEILLTMLAVAQEQRIKVMPVEQVVALLGVAQVAAVVLVLLVVKVQVPEQPQENEAVLAVMALQFQFPVLPSLMLVVEAVLILGLVL